MYSLSLNSNNDRVDHLVRRWSLVNIELVTGIESHANKTNKRTTTSAAAA